MEDNTTPEKEYWFKKKNFGWGWQPATWQGWLVLFMYLFGVLSDGVASRTNALTQSDAWIGFTIRAFVLTAFLLIICYKTGEKPEWRWGIFNRKDKDDSQEE